MGIEFYEDEDAVEAVDRWGEHCWIVGQTVEGNILWVWTVNDKGEFGGVHPESISILVGKRRKHADLVPVRR